jgi:hypothetical protein
LVLLSTCFAFSGEGRTSFFSLLSFYAGWRPVPLGKYMYTMPVVIGGEGRLYFYTAYRQREGENLEN